MELKFKPPGPVAHAFLEDRSPVSAIMGPMGSGKTSTLIMKTVHLCQEQAPSPLTGERLFKLGVVRDTLTNLKRTTVKSVQAWFGEAGEWGGGGSSADPPYFKVGFKLPDGTVARLWYDFVGLDVHNIELLSKGWEITGYWLNEGDLLPADVKTFLDGRAGRYPAKRHGGPTWYGGLLDYNAPDTENYCYKLFEETKPEGHKLFKQPGGRDPRAENLANLPENYYERIAEGKEDWWVRRNVDNLYGFSRDGKPVYPEYRDDFHCAAEQLKPVVGIPIKFSVDQGLHPAGIFRQTMPNGQRRILDEVYAETGAKGLAEAAHRLIGEKYAGHRVIGGAGDPSGNAGDASDGEPWFDSINRLMNFTGATRIKSAQTNDPDKRQASVRQLLKTNVDDGRPGLLISPSCPILRKGFNSDYRYKRMRTPGMAQYSESPEKKFPVADVHDALQYDCLDDGGYENAIGREQRRGAFASSKTYKANIRIGVPGR